MTLLLCSQSCASLYVGGGDEVAIRIAYCYLPRSTVPTDGFSSGNSSYSFAHLSAATDEPTVLAVESIAEVIFVERGVLASLRYLIKDTIRPFYAKNRLTITADQVFTDGTTYCLTEESRRKPRVSARG